MCPRRCVVSATPRAHIALNRRHRHLCLNGCNGDFFHQNSRTVALLVALHNGPGLRSILGTRRLVTAMLLALAEWKNFPFVSVWCSVVETLATLLASCTAQCNMDIHAQEEESSTARSTLKWCIHIERIPFAGQCIDTCREVVRMEEMRCAVLYTNRWRSSTLIRTERVDREIGSCPLPWGVVMSKEEKRRTLALFLTHRVGREDNW